MKSFLVAFFFGWAMLASVPAEADGKFWNMSRHNVYLSLLYEGGGNTHISGWTVSPANGGAVMQDPKPVQFGSATHQMRLKAALVFIRKPTDYLGVRPVGNRPDYYGLCSFRAPGAHVTTYGGTGKNAAQGAKNYFDQNQPGNELNVCEYTDLRDWEVRQSGGFYHGISADSKAAREINNFFN